MIERVTGSRPPGCPWVAFEDSLVGAVIDAWSTARSGAEVRLSDARREGMPHVVWQGVVHYHHAFESARHRVVERARKAAGRG